MSLRGSKHRQDIQTVLSAFGDEANDFVFLGGCAMALYARESGAPLRTTTDVDCLSRRTPWALQDKALADLCARRVIKPDKDLICRYRICGTEIDVDVISPDGINVGGGNHWLRRAADNYALYSMEGRQVKAITPAYFLVTKLLALEDRGDDILSSKDAEDIVALAVERENLVSEVADAGLQSDIRDLWDAVGAKFKFSQNDIPEFVDYHLHPDEHEHHDRVVETVQILWPRNLRLPL